MLITRCLSAKFQHYLNLFPIVALIGPRQAGKTTFAKMELSDWNYFDLEKISDFRRIDADIEFFLKEYGIKCIIDEVQTLPALFPALRSHVDERRDTKGQIVLLGSVNPLLIKNISESLAGRIGFIELSPFVYNEIFENIPMEIEKFWFLGGYPEPLTWQENDHLLWIEQYIKTFVERDIHKFLHTQLSSQNQTLLLKMLAHVHGKLWNAAQISSAFGVSYHTINTYIDLLEKFFIIRRLPPYYMRNVGKRLIKRNKFYYRDTGLLHYLLEIFSIENLRTSPYRGFSFEGFVIEHLIQIHTNNRNKTSQFYFYRTAQGDEIDLLVLRNNTLIAYEIKVSTSIDSKQLSGFIRCLTQLNINEGIVVYFGKESFQMTPKIKVQSIYSLLKQKW